MYITMNYNGTLLTFPGRVFQINGYVRWIDLCDTLRTAAITGQFVQERVVPYTLFVNIVDHIYFVLTQEIMEMCWETMEMHYIK